MNNINEHETELDVRPVIIYLIASGKSKMKKNGVYALTEWGKEKLQASIKKNFRGLLSTLRPDYFFCSGRYDEMETLDLLTGLLEWKNNGKSKRVYPGLNTILPPGVKEIPSKRWWKRAKACARLRPFSFFGWKKVRTRHWLAAGGRTADDIKLNTDQAIDGIIRIIALHPKGVERQIGIISGQAEYFNLLKYNLDLIPPIHPGNVIKYQFFVRGSKAERIDCLKRTLFSA
ncbi:MAG: hypothetical protein PHE24_05775 [Patescibacteria group bacterium]|nr:hypothetical protein [Patescibacteria group bacterium]